MTMNWGLKLSIFKRTQKHHRKYHESETIASYDEQSKICHSHGNTALARKIKCLALCTKITQTK